MDEPHDPIDAARRREALAEFAMRWGAAERAATARLDQAAAEAITALEAAGAGVLLLKGRGLAALLYEAGEFRAYADADLLIEPSHLGVVDNVLSQLGYTNAADVHGIEDVGRAVHADSWTRATDGDATSLDVHRWIPGTASRPEDAWPVLAAHAIEIELGSGRARALDTAGQALHLALHAAQHGPSFGRHLNELELAVQRWPDLVWSEAAEIAAKIGASAMFTAGLRLIDSGVKLADRLKLTADPVLDWEVRTVQSRPRGTGHLKALKDGAGFRPRLALVRRALFPTRAWIRYQYRWAERNAFFLGLAYARHLLSAPVWAARAWRYQLRSYRRRARPRAEAGD